MVLAEAAARVIAAIAPANNATFTIDVRIFSPLSQKIAPQRPARGNILHRHAKDASHFARQNPLRATEHFAKPMVIGLPETSS